MVIIPIKYPHDQVVRVKFIRIPQKNPRFSRVFPHFPDFPKVFLGFSRFSQHFPWLFPWLFVRVPCGSRCLSTSKNFSAAPRQSPEAWCGDQGPGYFGAWNSYFGGIYVYLPEGNNNYYIYIYMICICIYICICICICICVYMYMCIIPEGNNNEGNVNLPEGNHNITLWLCQNSYWKWP